MISVDRVIADPPVFSISPKNLRLKHRFLKRIRLFGNERRALACVDVGVHSRLSETLNALFRAFLPIATDV